MGRPLGRDVTLSVRHLLPVPTIGQYLVNVWTAKNDYGINRALFGDVRKAGA